MELSGKPIVYGSMILLARSNEYFYSHGFIDNSLYLADLSHSDVMGAVFRILPQSMYTVQNYLLHSIEIGDDPITVQNNSARLEEALEGEIKTNIQTYKAFKGHAVLFGSLVQLEHIWTHKFLTLKPQQHAEIEKDNLKLVLEDFGGESSHFRIEPCYKYQEEGGGLVRVHDKVVFEAIIPEPGKSAFIHCSESLNVFNPVYKLVSTGINEKQLEVNASLDHKTAWEIKVFSDVFEEGDSLKCGECIWLTHSEENMCLSVQGQRESKVVFTENLNDTNGLWRIESEAETEGGSVMIEKFYRFRHLSSGLYLSIEDNKAVDLGSLAQLSMIIASKVIETSPLNIALAQKTDSKTVWKIGLLPGRSDSKLLHKDDFCRIINKETGLVLFGREGLRVDDFVQVVPRLSFTVHDYSYFKVYRSDEKLIWETLFLLKSGPILKKFPRCLKEVSKENSAFAQPRGLRKYCQLIKKCISEIDLFVQNKLKGMTTIDRTYGEVQLSRQKLVREQRIIDYLVRILKVSFTSPAALARLDRHRKQMKKSGIYLRKGTRVLSQEDFDNLMIESLEEIDISIYNLLITICKNNCENQKYTYRFYKVFQGHAGYGLGASKCMINMIGENEKTLIGLNNPDLGRNNENIIKHYVWLLRKNYRERKPQLLEFLKSVCIFQGEGITINQEKLHEYLFGDPENYTKAVIMTTTMEDQQNLYVTLQNPEEGHETLIALEDCFSNGKISKFHKEIAYFITMLELFASMCVGRNFICKNSIQDWFPLTAITYNIQNEALSLETRAAFCKLLATMYIDAHPREHQKKPGLIRVLGLSPQTNASNLVRSIHTISGDYKLDSFTGRVESRKYTFFSKIHTTEFSPGRKGKLKNLIAEVFNGNKDGNRENAVLDKNDFLCIGPEEKLVFTLKGELLKFFNCFNENTFDLLSYQLILLAIQMAKFEIFGNYCSDFQNDFIIINPNSKKFLSKSMDIVLLLKGLVPILFLKEERMFRSVYKENKKQTVLDSEKKDYNPRGASSIPAENKGTLEEMLNDAETEGDPMVLYSMNFKNFLNSYANKRVSDSSADETELKSKVEICNYIQFYLNCQLECHLENVIEWFNRQIDSELDFKEIKTLMPPILELHFKDPEIEKISKDITKSSSYKCYKKPKIPDINCVYEKHELQLIPRLITLFCTTTTFSIQSEILIILIRCYSQREEFLSLLKKLHTIATIEDTDLFYWTKTNLEIFKQRSEQSELCLKYWQQKGYIKEQNHMKFEKILEILRFFEYIMHGDTTIVNGVPKKGVKNVISADRQRTFLYLDAHIYIINLIKDGMYTLCKLFKSATTPEEIQGKTKLTELFTLCYKILRKLVQKNPKSQRVLHKYLHIFTSHLSIPVQQIPLICEIFRNNLELCTQVTEDFLALFIDLILIQGRQPRFLEIFEVIQTFNGKALHEVQRKVLFIYLSKESQHYLMYMNSPEDLRFCFEKQAPSLKSFTEYRDVPFYYHAKLIKLLTACGTGRTGVYLNEAKCQKLIPLRQVLALLGLAEDPSSEYRLLKQPLLEFIHHIYQDTEKITESLSYCAEFISYIELQTSSLASMTQLDEDFSSWFPIWIQILHRYYTEYLENNDESNFDDDLAIKNYIEEVTIRISDIAQVSNIHTEVYDQLLYLINGFELENDFEFSFEYAISTPRREEEDMYTVADMLSPIKEQWSGVIEELIYNEAYTQYIEQERTMLRLVISNIHLFNPNINVEDIIQKMINFIRIATARKALTSVIIKPITFLGDLICNPMQIPSGDNTPHMTQIQNLLNNCGATTVALKLMCDRDIERSAFKIILNFCVKLLAGGNENVQNECYYYFISAQNSEIFFERLYSEIEKYISDLSKAPKNITKRPIYKPNNSVIHNSLKVLQLLCENHNTKLQNYLRFQEKSRTSYDFVKITVLLLGKLLSRKSSRHFFELSQCFDTLTEFVQGPCHKNQESIIDKKFPEFCAGLLSLAETEERFDQMNDISIGYAQIDSIHVPRKLESLSGWMIAHLKFKCMVTLHSLLEGRTDSYILTRMIRAFNFELFRANLIRIYTNYATQYGEYYYESDLFQHYVDNEKYVIGGLSNPQDENPDYYSLIIEVGFLIYHLIRKFRDNNDPENGEYIKGELPDLAVGQEGSNLFGVKMIGDIGKLGFGIAKQGWKFVMKIAKRARRTKLTQEEESQNQRYSIHDAYKFFESNTGSVEVVFHNDKLHKVYFWLLPETKNLTEEIKEDFHSKVDRTSEKSKLNYLMLRAPDLIEQMKHEA